MDYTALREEILTGPLAAEVAAAWAAGDDAAVAAVLNRSDLPARRKVTLEEVTRLSLERGVTRRLMEFRATSYAAEEALLLLQSPLPLLDLDGPAAQRIVGDLVAGELMTAADETALSAIADTTQSRVQAAGFGFVSDLDVARARAVGG